MADNRPESPTPPRKGQLNHCSPAEPEQHFETKALECCSFSPIVRQWSSEITAAERYFTSTMTVKMPVLASDRGKIVERTPFPRLSWRMIAADFGAMGRTRQGGGGILQKARFYTDTHQCLSRKKKKTELKSLPRFFHDFSTIRAMKHKKSPCFTMCEKW